MEYSFFRKVEKSEIIKDLDLTWNLIETSDFIKFLDIYPKGDISLDYEATGVKPWDPHTLILGMGFTLLNNPYQMPSYIHFNRHLTEEEKSKFIQFLNERKVWVFNLTYEGGVTWRYFKHYYE